jgi:release factor glutamine methyltransferase
VTVRVIADHAAQALVARGFAPEDARRDVSVLARHVLGWTMADWVTNAGALSPTGFAESLQRLVLRRMTHEPVAYITGVREFYGREFMVTRAVLIPRPETEGIIEAIPAGLPAAHGSGTPVILDIGTGSGCLAITLALEHPAARVIATDVSQDALSIAAQNAQRLGAHRAEFVEASLVPSGLPPLDLIVTNPPYVPERDRESLSPDVRDFEPAQALFAGEDGLGVIRDLLPEARAALKPGGALIMEIGAGQAEAVAALVAGAGLRLITIRPDLQGIPRIAVAVRPPQS